MQSTLIKDKSKQLKLFKEENRLNNEEEFYNLLSKAYTKEEALQLLKKINWDFSDFKTQYLTHRFHSYPARFIPQIPSTFIKLFTKEGDTILDPMCGCGTTLVEAFLNNRNTVGNDMNPLATLITKVKTTIIPESGLKKLESKLFNLKKLEKKVKDITIQEEIKLLPRRNLALIFNKNVVRQLLAIKLLINEFKKEKDYDLYDLCRVALSYTIWSLTENEEKEDVSSSFIRKVCAMKKEIMATENILEKKSKVKIINSDSRKLKIKSNSIDLIVTSPPYVNALDYYRQHMYSMHWLDMDYKDFKNNEIGGHSHFIHNRFRLLSEYLGDMFRSMMEMNRVLKKGKLAAIVVGNSSLEYELMENYKYFSAFAPTVGFRPHASLFRNIDKTKKYTNDLVGQIDDEYILVLEKTNDFNKSSTNEDFIFNAVLKQMNIIREKIKKSSGSSIRGKVPTKQRLSENTERISEAIKTIKEDIKIKKQRVKLSALQ